MKNEDIKDYVIACLRSETYMKNIIRRYGGAGNDANISTDQMADAIIRLHISVKQLAIKFDMWESENHDE